MLARVVRRGGPGDDARATKPRAMGSAPGRSFKNR
jgi:hypothetical protein